MAGTTAGGMKSKDSNIRKFGEDFYRRIGRIGGSRGAKDGALKGFAQDRKRASWAGTIGGSLSAPYSVNPKKS